MPCITYLDDRDVECHAATLDHATDADLIELLGEINARPDERWSLRRLAVPELRWRFGPLQSLRYRDVYYLYSHVHGLEWQAIHFAGVGLGMGLDRAGMTNFLLGYRMGLEQGDRT
jgi:hypothetical protein